MAKRVRVRFAPSPTGHLHIGGLRTALFNLLFARHKGGDFLLRIEDTDPERSLEKYTQEIISSLAWTDILADEPLVIQSKKIKEHAALIEQLLKTGVAYRCYCMTNPDASSETYFKYDGKCRVIKQYEPNKPFVVRIKLPLEKKSILFNDLIRGPIEFDLDQFDDFIIARSDGTPMYNFVVVADDAAMGITHVIRGEEHIANTPKQIVLYEALGFQAPEFAHLPLILSQTGQKLSKRDAAVAVIDYKKQGYLPDALCNYLVRLGWSHGDQEIFTRQELIEFFTLENIGKKGAIFDQNKLEWVNSLYIKEKTSHELLALIEENVEPNWRSQFSYISQDKLCQALDLYKERVLTLRQLVDEVNLLFKGPISYSEEDKKKYLDSIAVSTIDSIIDLINTVSDFSEASLQDAIKNLAKNLHVSLATLAQPIRIALLGKTTSPGIFALLSLIGKKETLSRLSKIKDILG